MKQKDFLLKSLLVTAMMGLTLAGNAQHYDQHNDQHNDQHYAQRNDQHYSQHNDQHYAPRYEIDRGRVYYGDEPMVYADARSFVDLGCGYAKDKMNVYLDGRVLENVDPSTFRLKERATRQGQGHFRTDEPDPMDRGYYKTKFNVYFGTKKIDAMASSFTDLGGGYGKDSFNVYYFGEKIKGCMASRFEILEGGYSRDSFSVYYRGNKVEGAQASSFKYTGNGYGQDNFNAYYRGKKLK